MPGAIAAAAYKNLTLSASSFGGSVSTHPPVFSLDERFLFCCAGQDIKVVSLNTGETVRLLQSHADTVTSLAINPQNSLQLYSASINGTVLLWDYNDGVVLSTFKMNVPINHLVLHPSLEKVIFVSSASKTRKGKSETKQVSYVYEAGIKPVSEPKKLFKLGLVSAIALAPKQNLLVAISKKRLFVYPLAASSAADEDLADDSLRKYNFNSELTTVDVNEASGCVAVGDVSGAITLSYCLGETQKEAPINTLLHWHAHSVSSLAFSPSGDYLISGGSEAVLVIWQIATRQKNFLPRLGAPITSVAVSPLSSYYCAGHDDSSLHVVSSLNLAVKATVQGVKLVGVWGLTAAAMNTGLVFEPRHNALVLNSTPGCLQFYQPILDRHITEVDVVPRNRISRRENSRIGFAVVDHVAFSPNGAWMASIDRIEDTEAGSVESSTLKFWRLDESTQHYVLNTRIDCPHGSHEVTSLVFHPNGKAAITAGNDKRFRTWKMSQTVDRSSTVSSSWNCQSVGFFREYQSRDAAISSDGSLLAVAFQQMVTLWDPATNQLHQTLCHPPPDCPVLGLDFIRNSHFLVTFTRTHLYVWNLLTCSVWWMLELNVKCFAIDPVQERFAVVVAHSQSRHERRKKTWDTPSKTVVDEEVAEEDKQQQQQQHKVSSCEIVIFSPTLPVPLLRHAYSDTVFRAIAFVPQADDQQAAGASVQLVATDGKSQFIRFDSSVEAEEEVEGEDGAVAAEPGDAEAATLAPVGRLTAMFGSLKATSSSGKQQVALSDQAVVNPQSMPSVLAAPAHVIPAVHRIYAKFMQELLRPRSSDDDEDGVDKVADAMDATSLPAATTQDDEDEEEDEDEDEDSMEVDTKKEDQYKKMEEEDIVPAATLESDFSFLADVFLSPPSTRQQPQPPKKSRKSAKQSTLF